MTTTWGVTPDELRARLREQEWDRSDRLRARLSGERPFPIRIALKPPSGRQALESLERFRRFFVAWEEWDGPGEVEFQTRKLPQVGEQKLPTHFQLNSMRELAAFVGHDAQQQWERWQAALKPLQEWNPGGASRICRRLEWLENFTPELAERCVRVLEQLKPGMGQGLYLRSLPLSGVDTKFVEDNLNLLGTLHGGSIQSETSGVGREGDKLVQWLDCVPSPSDWLLIRPLDRRVQKVMGDIGLLKVSATDLLITELPGSRVILIENAGPAYALPQLPDTVAICGFGANLSWASASWLASRDLAYWGDIDTWGLHYLSAARSRQPHLRSLMMDEATLRRFHEGMALDKAPNPARPEHLTADELRLYGDLLGERYRSRGLEQERIAQDYAVEQLRQWACS